MTILDELLSAEEFRGLSPAEFFYRNREIAGFSNPVRALYQTVRELVENSLDATELYRILPDIRVRISYVSREKNIVKVSVRDNGIGIPLKEVPNVFGKVFYGSKYKLRQSRGVFGLGIKMAVLYAQMTTGSPVLVRTASPKSKNVHEFQILIDITRNEPIVVSYKTMNNTRGWHGTHVELTLEGNWSSARSRIVEYIKRTALIAPYASISFEGPGIELSFPRATKKIPVPPSVGKPHPRGVDIELLKQLIAYVNSSNQAVTLEDFLVKVFDGVGRKTARSFLKWAGYGSDLLIDELSIEQLDDLARKMKGYGKWRRPRPLSLSPLGEELLVKGVRKILKPEFVTAITRKPSSYGGYPFVVEVAIAWGGDIPSVDRPLLLRFANKIPLLYDEGVDVSRKVIDGIDWSVYKIKFPAPLAIITHLCSTKIPFKGVGKEAIADVPEVERELEIALREAARRLKRHISRIERQYEVKLRYITINKYIGEIARALSVITGKESKVFEKKLSEIVEQKVLKGGGRGNESL